MSKAALLSVAFFVPAQDDKSKVAATIGSRAKVGELFIEREDKSWRKTPEKVVLKPRDRHHVFSSERLI